MFYVIHVILSCLKHVKSQRKRTCPSTSPSLLTVLSSVSIFGAMKFASSLRLGSEERREAASVLLEAQGEASEAGDWGRVDSTDGIQKKLWIVQICSEIARNI